MLTKEQLKPLLELGYTQQKIADELKCSRADVHYYLTKYKLSTGRNSPHKKKLSEDEFQNLKSLVDKGLNNVEIGKIISRHRDIVRKYLNLYGIKRNG